MNIIKKIFSASIIICLICFISCDKQISISEPDQPVSTGKLLLNSNPQGAEIFLDGYNTGQITPDSILFLEEGLYSVKFRMSPYLDIIDTTLIQYNDIKEIMADFTTDRRNFGSIAVFSEPTNALIYVNDSSTGRFTPDTLSSLWPGLYHIKLTYPECRDRLYDVRINGGQNKVVDLVLQDTSTSVNYNLWNSNFPTLNVICVTIDKNDIKWIGSEKGLVKYNDWEFTVLYPPNLAIVTNTITCIEIDNQNRKWIGTQLGLAVLDNNENWTIYTRYNSSIPNDYINAITFDSKGNTWIGASDPRRARLLLKFDGSNWTSYEVPDSKLITSLTVDNEDRIWVGLNLGLLVFDGDEWIAPEGYSSAPTMLSLNLNPVESLLTDEQGRIWVGCATYLSSPGALFIYDQSRFEFIDTPARDIAVMHLAENGNVWISPSSQYPLGGVADNWIILMKIDPLMQITTYTLGSTGLPSGIIRDCATQSNGDLWLATRDNGIIKYKKGNL